jgi:hypothetical protein
LYALNAFGAFAAVTVYAPGAEGDVEPRRVIKVRPQSQTSWRTPPGALGSLVVDTTGAVQVWFVDGARVYAPGAPEGETPLQVTLQKAVEGERGAVTVAGDGTLYQAIGPGRGDARFPFGPEVFRPLP